VEGDDGDFDWKDEDNMKWPKATDPSRARQATRVRRYPGAVPVAADGLAFDPLGQHGVLTSARLRFVTLVSVTSGDCSRHSGNRLESCGAPDGRTSIRHGGLH
jgi:hypothetical protein